MSAEEPLDTDPTAGSHQGEGQGDEQAAGAAQTVAWTTGQDLAAIAGELVDPAHPGPSGPGRGPEVTRLDGTVLGEVAVIAAQKAFASFFETEAAEALVNTLNPTTEAVIGAAADDAVRQVLAGGGKVKPARKYRDVDQWVNQFLLTNYRRPVGGDTTWCASWWEHSEAISRLEALWYAWEEARHNGGAGMAAWWVHFADPMLAALTAPRGPFHKCGVDHVVPARLPVEPAPKGMFPRALP